MTHLEARDNRTRIVPARAAWGRTAKEFRAGVERKAGSRVKHEVTTEAGGILVLLTRSIFACDILRKLLLTMPLTESEPVMLN